MTDTARTQRLGNRRAVSFVFVTVLIDAMGIGIIIPVMPDLIRELGGISLGSAAIVGGYLTFVYALMQFASGPTLGNLSDRFGRRPVLLISLFALAVDYLIMGFAPTLLLLFVGRALAGVAGATYSTANAFIADISPADRRGPELRPHRRRLRRGIRRRTADRRAGPESWERGRPSSPPPPSPSPTSPGAPS